jgi:hypothetical protein
VLKILDEQLISKLEKYHSKKVTPSKAIKKYIKPGDRIFIDSACAEPLSLTKKLIVLAPEISVF